jgi:hypothetical protein
VVKYNPKSSEEPGEALSIEIVPERSVSVRLEALQIVFDTMINTLNFGSGFLDDKEVEALREIAVVIGIDPMSATPEKFHCKYEGEHRYLRRSDMGEIPHKFEDYLKSPYCLRCHQYRPNQEEYLDWCNRFKDEDLYE